MRRILVLMTIWLFCLTEGSFPQSGQWLTRTPMPTGRQETTPAVLDGKIFLPGGYNPGAVVTTIVEVYDPITNTWATVAPVPELLHHYGIASVGNKVFLLGGYAGNTFTPTNRAYVFVANSNYWRRIADLPVARGAHVAVEYGGKVYLFGGIISGVATVRTDVYDPATNTWATVANMPTAREHTAAACIDSLIYVIGGRIGSNNNAVLETYSPAINTWHAKASMPTARGGLAAAAWKGRLYVFGGEFPGVYPQNEEYNPATNTWRTMAPMLTPRHGTGAVTVADSVYVIGGAIVQGFGATDVNELFTLVEPRVALSKRLMDMGSVAISNCRSDSLVVKNIGNATLQVSSITSTNPRFFPTPASASISPGDSIWLKVNFCSDFPIGVQTGNLVLTHNGFPSRDTVQMRGTTIVTGVDDEQSVPRSFSLKQNYPNPFNPSTVIEYDLPYAAHIRLSVFDLLGREVKLLVNGRQNPGSYRVHFHAEEFPNGVYFYNLHSENFSAFRKMLLLK